MELDTLFGQASSDRRATARIPAGATLLHRAVGMRDYAPCAVVSVTTSGIELLGERPLEPGTVVTILVRPEASPRKYYRVIGSVVRRVPRHPRWLHVIKAATKRPWSTMFIYDVMYQALAGSTTSRAPGHRYLDDAGNMHHDLGTDHSGMTSGLESAGSQPHAAPRPRDLEDGYGDPAVYRALSWSAPFHALNDLLRQFIAHEQRTTKMPAGTTLVQRGSLEDVSIYLIEGTVEAEPHDGKRFRITAGTPDAHHPISVLRPHAYTVTAATDVTVILLSQDMVRKLARITAAHNSSLSGIEVSELDSLPGEVAGT